MSEALIPVGQGMFPVKGRDVHSFLELGRDFTTWIRARLDGFAGGVDYIVERAPQNGGAASTAGGSNRLEYFLTIDTAKHLCMIERNDKGRQLRQWFIDRENKLAQVEQAAIDPANLSRLDILKMAIDSEEQRVALAKENAVLAPKAEAYDHHLTARGNYTMEEAAKVLGVGPRKLWAVLKDRGIVYERKKGSRKKLVPKQTTINAGYMDMREYDYERDDGRIGAGTQIMVTPRGLFWLRKNLIKEGMISSTLPLPAAQLYPARPN